MINLKTPKATFTTSDMPQQCYDVLDKMYEINKADVRYICAQLQIDEETGKLQLSGYVQLYRSQRESWYQSHLDSLAKWTLQPPHTSNEITRDDVTTELQRIQPLKQYGQFCYGPGCKNGNKPLTIQQSREKQNEKRRGKRRNKPFILKPLLTKHQARTLRAMQKEGRRILAHQY